jgi:hypothetical protein
MTTRYYYRKVRATGIWHILSRDTTPDEFRALCGESCVQCSAGYMQAGGRRREDPPGLCARCKALADGGKQLTLMEATNG